MPSDDLSVLIEQDENVLLSVLVSSLNGKLMKHESICLANVLQNHIIRFDNGSTSGPLTASEIAESLAHLSSDYDKEFLAAEKANNAEDIAYSKRVDYWVKTIVEVNKLDEPLNYLDRTTISRLKETILSESRVKDMAFV